MSELKLEADVLVIGGGMAAGWAAIAAARAGARVVLADKGFVGTSGVTATAGPNHWWVPPDPVQREAAIGRRFQSGFGLADKAWMGRVIDTTWRILPELAPYYPFSRDGAGGTFYSGVRGPEYMRALRNFATDLGVRILDHHPALELLLHPDGSVAGAAGYARLERWNWSIRAGAVVMATGGCAFRSGLIGSRGNTGDGYLMAVEAGAELSGMEFSVAYTLSPAWCSTRTLPYTAARFFDADGNELDIPPGNGAEHLRGLAAAFRRGPVYADLRDAPAPLRSMLGRIQPATAPPFARKGVRLFDERFEVKLFGEGTIRGTGGLRIADAHCQTTVRGLFAAGDAATRELVAGATSGGGAQNSAWALTSGYGAGEGAAALARNPVRGHDGPVLRAGRTALRPASAAKPVDDGAAIAVAAAQILPLDKALWRERETLEASQLLLDQIWAELVAHRQAEGLDQVGAREAAAIVATARWCNFAALARPESRGIHLRADAPRTLPELTSRLVTGGTDALWTRFEADLQAGAAA
jgi:succinate dehydrogenase/fumarate reductase flavoprotein subunit